MNVAKTSSMGAHHALTRLVALCGAWAIGVLAAPAYAEPIAIYRGICNASAGIDLGAGYFVVADDDIDSLIVYRYGMPDAVAELKVGDYLNGWASKDDEADLEGAARIGDRMYWIASHSGKPGEPRLTRQHLFATRIVTTSAMPAVALLDTKPYDKLLTALASDGRFGELKQAMSKDAEDDHGFNIEGLSATPDGGLLIGFRNPLVGKRGDPKARDALVLESGIPLTSSNVEPIPNSAISSVSISASAACAA